MAQGLQDKSSGVGFPAWNRLVPHRAMGYIITTDPEGPDSGAETLMCVHCQYHWKVDPGSGKRRGFCFNCQGPTCGKQKCDEGCEPWEAAIERMEGKQRLFRISTQGYSIIDLGR